MNLLIYEYVFYFLFGVIIFCCHMHSKNKKTPYIVIGIGCIILAFITLVCAVMEQISEV